MSEEETTERVTMVWPKTLKKQVRDKVGPRGLTEFALDAVAIHLQGGAETVKSLEIELNSTKHLVQLLADRIAMGGDSVERLSAMMELELPHWLDTTGWPNEYAKLVKPELVDEVIPAWERAVSVGEVRDAEPEEPEVSTPVQIDEEPDPAAVAEGRRQHELARQRIAERTAPEPEVKADPWTPDLPHDKQSDDLFARLMAKTGGNPEFEGLKDQLKPASEIPKPAPVVQRDLCPTCNEELVDGECWTCM